MKHCPNKCTGRAGGWNGTWRSHHRLTDHIGLERTFKGHLVQLPALIRDTANCTLLPGATRHRDKVSQKYTAILFTHNEGEHEETRIRLRPWEVWKQDQGNKSDLLRTKSLLNSQGTHWQHLQRCISKDTSEDFHRLFPLKAKPHFDPICHSNVFITSDGYMPEPSFNGSRLLFKLKRNSAG